jgi:CRP-like cAMP-binding protein
MNFNQILFKEGESGHFFFLIKSGELELTLTKSTEKKYFKKGDTFGELALIQKNKRSATFQSVNEVELYCLESNSFKEVINRLNNNDLKERIYFLNLIPIFKVLNTHQLQEIARNMSTLAYKTNQIIMHEGEEGDSLFIIKKGIVNCIKNEKEIRKLSSKDFFGTTSLLFNSKRALTIKADEETICYQITKKLLVDNLGLDYSKIILQGIAKNAIYNVKMLKVLAIDEYFTKFFPLLKLNFYKNADIILKQNVNEDKKIIIVVEGNLVNVNYNLL